MTENRIIPPTSFQRDHCVQLYETVRKISAYEEMLKRRNGQPITLYVGQQNKLEIDGQYIKGMKRCVYSCYLDLKEQGLKKVANDILARNEQPTTNVK